MSTTQKHQLVIFHCLHCGAIQHAAPDCDFPLCCNKVMVHAASKTVDDDEYEAAVNSFQRDNAAEKSATRFASRPK